MNKDLKYNGYASEVVYSGLFAALMAVGAFIRITLPLGAFEVTVSLQLFFAILAGLLLGPGKGTVSVAAYIVLGLCGLPVFAHGGGPAYILRPTFGFVLGFVPAAFLSGVISLKAGIRGSKGLIAAAVTGEAAYYVCGLIYFYMVFNYLLTGGSIGIKELVAVWFLSTAVPDTLISVLAATVASKIRSAMEFDRKGSIHSR